MRRRKNKAYQNIILIDNDTSFAVREAYKVMRTNLAFTVANEASKTVVISSGYPGEGKTTTCVNLAITFAETGAKVLVIDADLRKPRIHTLFKGLKEKGLSHVLGGFAQLEEVIELSNYENLDFIAAGAIPPNPAELLTSSAMDDLLEQLSQVYEYIFIDTPPINVVTDATILATKVSGVLLVTRQNITRHKDIQLALENLQKVGAKVLGTMLNDMKVKQKGYGKYQKYSRSKRYGVYEGNSLSS